MPGQRLGALNALLVAEMHPVFCWGLQWVKGGSGIMPLAWIC